MDSVGDSGKFWSRGGKWNEPKKLRKKIPKYITQHWRGCISEILFSWDALELVTGVKKNH